MSRRALQLCASIEVLCPYCYEPQVAPDNGSHLWLPDQINTNQGGRTCHACGCGYALVFRGKVEAHLSKGTRES